MVPKVVDPLATLMLRLWSLTAGINAWTAPDPLVLTV